MKLHFEGNLDYQLQAIDAVCDLFRGQEWSQAELTVTRGALGAAHLAGEASDLGVGNRLRLSDDQLLANLRAVQLRNGLAQSSALGSLDFTVEMETGTGKTYVYLRTIYELNKRYGFGKFVIVVPSVAIREGVRTSLQATRDHLRSLYAGVPLEHFVYDSGRLGEVRSFASSAPIQVMVMTVAAINKRDVNNLYRDSEKTGGEKPIDLIRATRPIIIVDEPQSVDGGLEGRGRKALEAMSPLCTLRYSATHQHPFHKVYRLDAVEAYQRGLVKQIEVAAATVEHDHSAPYLRVVDVARTRGIIAARVELDVQTRAGVRRQEVVVHDGDDLAQRTGRSLYAHHHIGAITVARGQERVELRLPGGQRFLGPGEAHGGVDESMVARHMMRRTIFEHLDKQRRLHPRGIKVLSLLFVDAVETYRSRDASGRALPGELARIFEEEYRRAAHLPEYRDLFDGVDLERQVERVHDGYFSIDRKGGWTDTDDRTQAGRESAERAYDLIMRDKERLLSLETPLAFIFSHSALREGWDNPNVFQICALREMRSEQQRRQTVGRGLRLCVNQAGERLRGFELNTLTVIARESYQRFAEGLQRELEEETGLRLGVVEPLQLASLTTTCAEDGTVMTLGVARAASLWQHLQAMGYLDSQGKVTCALGPALASDQLRLPDDAAPYSEPIKALLVRVAGGLAIRDADARRSRHPAAEDSVREGPSMRSPAQASVRGDFDQDALIAACIRALAEAPPLPVVQLRWQRARLFPEVTGAGAAAADPGVAPGVDAAPVVLDERDVVLPDLLSELAELTGLTRRSLYAVVTQSGRLGDFPRNPQAYIELVADTVNRRVGLALGGASRRG